MKAVLNNIEQLFLKTNQSGNSCAPDRKDIEEFFANIILEVERRMDEARVLMERELSENVITIEVPFNEELMCYGHQLMRDFNVRGTRNYTTDQSVDILILNNVPEISEFIRNALGGESIHSYKMTGQHDGQLYAGVNFEIDIHNVLVYLDEYYHSLKQKLATEDEAKKLNEIYRYIEQTLTVDMLETKNALNRLNGLVNDLVGNVSQLVDKQTFVVDNEDKVSKKDKPKKPSKNKRDTPMSQRNSNPNETNTES